MTGQTSFFDESAANPGDLQTVTGLIDLQKWKGIGSSRAIKLAMKFGSWERMQAATDEQLVAIAGKCAEGIQGLRPSPEAGELEGIEAISYFDDVFPDSLRRIARPPAVLWVRGNLPSAKSIAIVGTRRPSPSGLAMAEMVAREAAALEWGVVSGLALGVDIAAHRGALAAGGATWAFLGSGVDIPTPEEHRRDAEAIIEQGGGLLSEVPPGTPVAPQHLVARNRLQAACSRVTAIIQCGIPSGTLHTARFTLVQGGYLAVVQAPADLSDPAQERKWAGNVALLDLAGCEAGVLSATGSEKALVEGRKPVADTRIGEAGDLTAVLEGLEHP